MMQSLIDISNMLDKNAFDQQRLLGILHHLEVIPVIPICLPSGSRIIRSNINDEHKLHTSISRLNYPPANKARTDRTSLEGKPMFYGTVFTSSAHTEGAVPRIFSAFETAEILRDYNNSGKVIVTQSVWETANDMFLFAFPYSRNLSRPCNEIKSLWDKWDQQKNLFSSEAVDFSEFIGEIITRPNYSCLYDITATIVDYVMRNYGVETGLFDGIYYPSVWGEGAGVNVCIKPKSIDNYVTFKRAKLVLFDKNVGHTFAPFVGESAINSDGSLTWFPTDYSLEMFKTQYGFKEVFSVNQGIVGIK